MGEVLLYQDGHVQVRAGQLNNSNTLHHAHTLRHSAGDTWAGFRSATPNRGTSLIRKRSPLDNFRRTMPRAL